MFKLPSASETYTRLAATSFHPAAFDGLAPGLPIGQPDFYRTPWLAFFDLMSLAEVELAESMAAWFEGPVANLLVGRHLLCGRTWLPDHPMPAFEPTEALRIHAPSGWFRKPPPVLVFLPFIGEGPAPEFDEALTHLDGLQGSPGELDMCRVWVRCFDLELAWLLMTLQDSATRKRLRSGLPPAERKSFDEQLLAAFAYFLGDLAGERDLLPDWRPEIALAAAAHRADPIGVVATVIEVSNLCFPEEYASLARSSGSVRFAPSRGFDPMTFVREARRRSAHADDRAGMPPTPDELVQAALLMNGEEIE